MNFKNIEKYKRILILPILISILFLNGCSTHAATLSIGVAPTSKVIKLNAGETYTDKVIFWNLAEKDDTYRIFVKAFKQIENQPGTAIIMTDQEDASNPYSASKWITTNTDEILLESNKNTKVEYTITVPKDSTDGEYVAQIFLISKKEIEKNGTKTFTNLAAGLPILIQIGDEFVENAELLEFTPEKKIYENINVDFYTRIKNLGDTHITPTGEIIIKNIFNQQIARIPFNNNKQSLLRDNLGSYIDNWSSSKYISPDGKIMFGPMTASLIVTYRSFQPGFATLTSTATFWIIPWKIILCILLGISIIVIFIQSRKRFTKKK